MRGSIHNKSFIINAIWLSKCYFVNRLKAWIAAHCKQLNWGAGVAKRKRKVVR